MRASATQGGCHFTEFKESPLPAKFVCYLMKEETFRHRSKENKLLIKDQRAASNEKCSANKLLIQLSQ